MNSSSLTSGPDDFVDGDGDAEDDDEENDSGEGFTLALLCAGVLVVVVPADAAGNVLEEVDVMV
jgi:hypothetical protein